MPLGDKNVWGTLYPIKKKKKVVMLATKVRDFLKSLSIISKICHLKYLLKGFGPKCWGKSVKLLTTWLILSFFEAELM